jgi:hypothetical protein
MSLLAASQLVITLIAAQASSATPAAEAYLPRDEAISGLVDGQLWTMTNTDGRNGRIRFNADGTGAIESPIKRRIKWTIEGNTFCMRMGFMLGTRCFQATRDGNGFQGYTKGKASVRFTR